MFRTLAEANRVASWQTFAQEHFPDAKADLGNLFSLSGACGFAQKAGNSCLVTPQNWLFLWVYAYRTDPPGATLKSQYALEHCLQAMGSRCFRNNQR